LRWRARALDLCDHGASPFIALSACKGKPMIIQKLADGSLVLITQTNHAEASGLFAANWGNDRFERPRPYQSAVRAAIYHDAGWYRYEAQPTYDVTTKSTPNFPQVPADPTQLAAYQWAIDWLTDIDPYAGALISRHRTGLWSERYHALSHPPMRSRRPLSDLVTAFMARNEARQEEALKSLDRDEFAINYHLLQVWDLLSLYICSNATLKEQYFEFAPTGYQKRDPVRMSLTPRDADRIALDPYPFAVRPLSVGYAYKHLATHDFPSEAAFLDAYYAAIVQTRLFEFI
jgi:hypothetical protein